MPVNRTLFDASPTELVSMLSHDAPRDVIDQGASSFDYRAVASRRDEITSSDFISLGRRFASLTALAYGGHSAVTLALNPGHGDTKGFYRPDPGSPVPLEGLDETSFEQVFAEANTLSLTIQPTEKLPGLEYSWAKMGWSRWLPSVLKFYAQDGGRADLPPGRISLQELLTRKMFSEIADPGLKGNLGIRPIEDQHNPVRKRGWPRSVLSSLLPNSN